MIERSNPRKSKAEIQAIKNQLANRITGVVHNLIQVRNLDPLKADFEFWRIADSVCNVLVDGLED